MTECLSGRLLMMSCWLCFLSWPFCTQSPLASKYTELWLELPSRIGFTYTQSRWCFSYICIKSIFFKIWGGVGKMLFKILQFLMLWQNPYSLLPLVCNNLKWLYYKSFAFRKNEKQDACKIKVKWTVKSKYLWKC